MGNVCLACGLLQAADNDPISIHTSGTWGGAGLAFPNGDTQGAPIYCDSAGKLRSPPEHTSEPLTESSSTTVGLSFSASVVNGHANTIVLLNPSGVRACSYLMMYRCKIAVNITIPLFAFRVEVAIDSAAAVTRQAQYWGLPADVPYSVEQILPDMVSGTMGPGGSVTFQITPGIDSTNGGGVGTLLSQSVRADAIMVTR